MFAGFCVASYVSGENGDVNMKFVHPKRPSEKLFWPQCDDVYWIPIEDVYCEAEAASSTGNTRRFYCFDKKNQKISKTTSMKTSSSIVHYYVSLYFPVPLTLSG